MIALLCLLLLAPSQRYLTVLLKNGEILVDRDSADVVVLARSQQVPPRGVIVRWSPVAALGVALVLREFPLPADTAEYRFRYAVGATTVRCTQALGCWLTLTNTDRSGYWRVEPNFTVAQIRILASVLQLAAQGTPIPQPLLMDLRP